MQRTQRDMSFDLDAAFSQRNAGELIREEQVRTKVIRTPGLRVVSAQGMYKPLHDPQVRSLSHNMGKPAMDLANFMDEDVTIPFTNLQVSVKHVVTGGLIGLAAWFLLRSHKKPKHA